MISQKESSSERPGHGEGVLHYMGFKDMYDPKGVHGFVDVLVRRRLSILVI